MDIFCPNKHLILDATTCPKCGWHRPISGTLGKSLWGPVDLLAGLGGESRDKFANMISVGDTLILALRSNELVGVSLRDGGILWRAAIPVGKNVVDLCLHLDKTLVVLQDTHSLTDVVECGCLHRIDPKNGQLMPLWAAPSHDLTAPIFHDGRMLIRTAESKLYCLDQEQPDQVYWQVDFQTWFATQPVLASDQIILLDGYAMFGEYKLVALNVQDGSLTWEKKISGIPSRPMTGNTQLVFVLDGRKTLLALDAQTGDLAWKKEISRMYAPPFADDEFIYLVIRGNEDPHAEDRYLLECLRVCDAEKVWQEPLSARVRLAPLLVDNTLLIADDDGVLHAKRVDNGDTLWEYPVGKKDDPIQTLPHLVGNHLIIGTYFGKLFAITVKQAPERMEDPQSYLEVGDIEEAAAAHALQEDYLEAAKIFDEKLHAFEEALQLYDKAQAYPQAAQLAFDHSHYSTALEYFRKSDDSEGEVKTHLAMGNVEEATKILRKTGEVDRAAQLMEDAGSFKQASQLYLEAGRIKDYLRLITKTLFDISELERLRASGNHETAAQWSMENGEYLEAAKDFRASGKEHEELDALKQFMQKSQDQADPWVWQRLAELGEGLGDHITAAEAWLKLDKPEYAADSYLKLASSLANQFGDEIDHLSNTDKNRISGLYQLAADAYQGAGLFEKEERCRHQVRRFQQLPKIIILEIKNISEATKKVYREMEWDILTLTLQNIGFGRAIDVTLNIGASRFEIQEESRRFRLNLSSGITHKKAVNLRPNKGHYGERVPLEIEWQWKDNLGEIYQDKDSIPVQVLPQRDSQTSTPMVIQNVENLVQGDHINGDKVDQKGDRVSVIRGNGHPFSEGINVKTDLGDDLNRENGDPYHLPKTKQCPQCGWACPSEANYCNNCQWDLREKE